MKNIVLIGFMGSGKSVISKALSEKLRWKVIDTDALVEKKAAIKIKKIFKTRGEEYFRHLETQAAKKASRLKNTVIATGGGIVKKEENIKILGKTGMIIYLKNSFETARKRLKHKKDRPLFNHAYIAEAKTLFKERLELYKAASDVVVITDGKSKDEVVKEILKKIKAAV